MIYITIILTGCTTSTHNINTPNIIICNNLNLMFLAIYNPTFLWPNGVLETFIISLCSFTYIIEQFVIFYQNSCEGMLMIVETVTEMCK